MAYTKKIKKLKEMEKHSHRTGFVWDSQDVMINLHIQDIKEEEYNVEDI